MTIKTKLTLNTVAALAAMVIVVGTAIFGTRLIKSNITELTQRTAPYQIKALNLQRALQSHATNLLSISSASSTEEYNKQSSNVSDSLSQVKKASGEMAQLKGESSPEDRSISDITKDVLEKVQLKITANDAAQSAADSIKGRLAQAAGKIKDLDMSIRKLQQGTSATMVQGVDGMMGENQQLNNLTTVRDGLKDLSLYILKIPVTSDKRSVATLRESVVAAAKTVVRALKGTKGIDKAADEIVPKMNVIQEKIAGTHGVARMQLQAINDEDNSSKDKIEAMAKEAGYEVTYLMPVVEREINTANTILKTSTGRMSRNISAFSDTNEILSYASALSLMSASIETHIIESIGCKKMNDLNRTVASISAFFAQADMAGRKLKDLLSKGNYKDELTTLNGYIGSLLAVRREFLGAEGVEGKISTSIKTAEELDSLNNRMKDLVSKQLQESNKDVLVAGENQERAVISVNSVAGSTMFTVGTVGALSIVMGFFIASLVTGSITKPLVATAEMIQDISSGTGDLTRRLEAKNDDETGTVCKGFNELVGKLHKSISDVAEKVDTVVSSANELSATAEQLSRRSLEQAEQTTTLSAAAEEMSAVVLDVAKNAQSSAESAEETRQTAIMGEQVVREAIDGINVVAQSINDISLSISDLSKDSERIGEIASVIKAIAEQTNLLALNAAIEAARAGAQGRGFAVVADSVRQLAEKTAAATTEITGMIKSIQDGANKSASSMNKGTEDVKKVVEKANKAEEALKQIVEKVEKQTGLITQMAAASNQQSTTVDSMVENISQVAAASNEFASGTSQIAKTAEDLDRVAIELQGVVKQFRL